MLILGNWSYAGTNKFVSHAVMLSTTQPPRTLCGMDVYELLNRKGQQWETEELTGSLIVGCAKCNRHLTQRVPDAGDLSQ